MTQPNDPTDPADPERAGDDSSSGAPAPTAPPDPAVDPTVPAEESAGPAPRATGERPAVDEPPPADEPPTLDAASTLDEPPADDEPAADEVDPAVTPEPAPGRPIEKDDVADYAPVVTSRSGSPSWALVVAVFLGVVIIGVGAYLLGAGSDDDPVATTTTIDEAPLDPDIEFTQFEDPATGVSFQYPSDWEVLDTNDPTVPIVLSDGGSNSLLVRVVPIEEPVTEENLPNLKATTDGILDDAGVSILEETEVEINGMPGYFYLYFIDDVATGQQGAHAHYFLFKEATMNILVFQSVPTEAFSELAPVFDEIVRSFESDPPDELPGVTTTTTAPPTSTTTTATTAPDTSPSSTAPTG